MQLVDYGILGLVLLGIVLALRHMRTHGCSGCSGTDCKNCSKKR